ncbi:uncharacterized protein DMAD_01245 [Drosophila madeirensis]|uniref:Uncharacterized protein n=1 Tax=Drosophila madeirensis TaxID=30013 RepID=A0AAU9G0T8_DROMD
MCSLTKSDSFLNDLQIAHVSPKCPRDSSPGCLRLVRESRSPHTLPRTTHKVRAVRSEELNIKAGRAATRACSQHRRKAEDGSRSLLNATVMEVRRRIREKLDQEEIIRHQRILEEEEEEARNMHQVSSTTLARLMGPLPIPPEFSMAARVQLEQNLKGVRAREAFYHFGELVDRINSRAIPRMEDLRVFFWFAAVLQFHMYLWHQPKHRRYFVLCYVLEDRCDFMAHVTIPCALFRELVDIYPQTVDNGHFVEDIFQLAPAPLRLFSFLKVVSNLIHARSLYDRLGELIYGFFQPQDTLLQLTRLQED